MLDTLKAQIIFPEVPDPRRRQVRRKADEGDLAIPRITNRKLGPSDAGLSYLGTAPEQRDRTVL